MKIENHAKKSGKLGLLFLTAGNISFGLMKSILFFLSLLLIGSSNLMGQSSQFMFVSSGTADNHAGIFVYDLNLEDEAIALKHKIRDVSTSSYLTIHPKKPYLYSVAGNKVSAFTIDKDNGSLSLINEQSSEGKGACYVSIDKTGKWAFVANYSGGNISLFPVGKDGQVLKAQQVINHEGSSVNSERQKAPHPHLITASPNNKFVLVPDLGADKIFIYKFNDKKGSLKPNDFPFVKAHPGAGPRHLAFHPRKNFCYVINELNATVTAYKWDPSNGVLTEIQTLGTLPESFQEFNKSADIHLTQNGRYLYTTNRGHNSFASFEVQADGSLQAAGHFPSGGDFPRNFFVLSDDQLVAANRHTGNIVLFDINRETGALSLKRKTGDIPSAQCIKVWKK